MEPFTDCSWDAPTVASWTYVEWKTLCLLSALLLALLIRTPETKLRQHLSSTAWWLLPTWFITSDVSWVAGRVIEELILSPS